MKLLELLKQAESTVENVGQWTGYYTWKEGFSSIEIWIGDKSGSRTNQYEATVKQGTSTQVRARTYSALVKKIVKAVEEKIPSNNG